METKNLLEKYPELIEKAREWDCSYTEAIKRIEEEAKRDNTLNNWLE